MPIAPATSTIKVLRSWLAQVTEVEFLRHRKRLSGLSRDQELTIRRVLLPSLVETLVRPLEMELRRQPSERATVIASMYQHVSDPSRSTGKLVR